jgi:hypothetical protein
MSAIITEEILRENPELVKGLTGLPAEIFWELVKRIVARYDGYEQKRLDRPDRQRAIGGGRDFDQPFVLRVAQVLAYARLHAPQEVPAALFGGTQTDVSRDLRRLLPLMQAVLPCPEVWQVIEEGKPLSEAEVLKLTQLADARAIVDATEQQVYRPGKSNEERKEYYSGKKRQFTLKSQVVTDGEHHIQAISVAVGGAKNDKKLSDELGTLDRLPDGCEVDADKGYQGLAKLVSLVTLGHSETGEEQQVPRLTVLIPFKKPKGGELSAEQTEFNRQLGAIRVRVEHCMGWIKNWKIIRTRFRCEHSIYTSILRMVCGLVNWQTERWQAAKAAV